MQETKAQKLIENQLKQHRLWLDSIKLPYIDQPILVYDALDGKRQLDAAKVISELSSQSSQSSHLHLVRI